ncbi:MAG: hypothetical protein HFH95_01990 [Lachnospiraceae bacterium]|nr:hypothetical protein [Lachnospiraceae bacterium]
MKPIGWCGESPQPGQDTDVESEEGDGTEKNRADDVGLSDVGAVETREDFLNLDAEAVFTEELLESVETADIENFQPRMAGFPILPRGNRQALTLAWQTGMAING